MTSIRAASLRSILIQASYAGTSNRRRTTPTTGMQLKLLCLLTATSMGSRAKC